MISISLTEETKIVWFGLEKKACSSDLSSPTDIDAYTFNKEKLLREVSQA